MSLKGSGKPLTPPFPLGSTPDLYKMIKQAKLNTYCLSIQDSDEGAIRVTDGFSVGGLRMTRIDDQDKKN